MRGNQDIFPNQKISSKHVVPNQTLHTKEWRAMINDKTTTGICEIPFKYQISQRASQESKK